MRPRTSAETCQEQPTRAIMALSPSDPTRPNPCLFIMRVHHCTSHTIRWAIALLLANSSCCCTRSGAAAASQSPPAPPAVASTGANPTAGKGASGFNATWQPNAASWQPELTLLPNNSYGARCLDGSPPGYYFRRGWGNGKGSWHVHLPWGGWCLSNTSCIGRSKTFLGSSVAVLQLENPYSHAWGYQGILSAKRSVNPRFYNWNVAVPIYCDGGGYAGRRGPMRVDSNTTLYSHGWKIMKAVLKDLLISHGISSAAALLLSGSSAGAQAVTTFCGMFGNALANRYAIKCLLDSGFFTDSLDRDGFSYFRHKAQQLTMFHLSIGNTDCAQAHPPSERWRCFFPQYALSFLTRLPVFIVQSLFDIRALMHGNQLPTNYGYARDCLLSLLSLLSPLLPKTNETKLSSIDPNQAFSWATKNENGFKEHLPPGLEWADGYTTYPLKAEIGTSDAAEAPSGGAVGQAARVKALVMDAGAGRGMPSEESGPTAFCKPEEVVAALTVANSVARFTKMLRRRGFGRFSQMDYEHAIIATALWEGSVVDGVSLRDAVASWFFS